jgi:TonB family protein
MTLGSAAPTSGSRRGLWLLLGLLGAVTVGGGAGWLYFVRVRGLPTPPPTTLSAKAVAAEARVRELEERIAQLEREKAQAEAGAAEEARRTLETQAAAGGKAADPAAVVRAQEEARRRARAEQERKQQDEMQRLAEQRSAEVQRLKEASPAPTPPAAAPVTTTPAAASTPTPLPEATPSPLAAAAGPPAVASTSPAPTPPAGASAPAGTAAAPPTTSTPAPGSRPADPSDPGVKPPVLVSEEPLGYPVRAVGRRIATSVVVRALVDEQGRVVEAAVVQASGQPPELGFDETALKRVRSRRYRPARRNDVPVSIWVVVRVDFRPPPPRF